MAKIGVAILVIFAIAPSIYATDYPIDWTLGKDYSSWATKDLKVGDKLVFTYGSSHTVDVVSKSNYDSCSASNAIESHNDGSTTITLKEGATYIICGTPGHCPGMQLQVNVKAASSSGGGSTPSTPSTTPSTPTTTTPSGSNGAGAISAMTPVLGAGVTLGLGIILGVMLN